MGTLPQTVAAMFQNEYAVKCATWEALAYTIDANLRSLQSNKRRVKDIERLDTSVNGRVHSKSIETMHTCFTLNTSTNEKDLRCCKRGMQAM